MGAQAILARVESPVGVDAPRHLAVGDALVRIEDAVLANADLLFPGLEVLESGLFRLVRSARLDIDYDENVDMAALVESELRVRRFAPVVAIRICDGMSDALKAALRQHLAVKPDRLIAAPEAAVGLGDLMALLRLPRPELRDPPHAPWENPALCRAPDIFRAISKAGTILLRHPYENFATSVPRLVEEASRDPAVRTIKMTLYRAESDSPLVAALIDAARRGKEVVVVFELKARFDEAANLRRSKALREAGAQVSHGALGLKTHCKTILVMRREKGEMYSYAHLGAGNYHGGAARLYGDVGLLTDDKRLTADQAELFNHRTSGLGAARPYRRLLTATRDVKSGLIARIDREIGPANAGRPALIQLKVNVLEDPQIVEALYRAAGAGVRIDLIVRDIRRLRPGVPGLPEGVRVVALVGRFLEHVRNRRCAMLDAQLADTPLAWTLCPDGTYALPPCADDSDPGSQSREIDADARQEKPDRAAKSDKFRKESAS